MSIITRINKAEKRIVDLYNKLKNLPSGGGGVQTISGDFVDNTDPLNPILNDPRPYKVYTALLSQSGTDAPVATVLENTLGDIEYNRNNIGNYSIVSNGLFIVGKTTIEFGVLNLTDAVSGQIILSDELTPNENEFQIYTRTTAFENQDGFTNVKIEIRVYN